MPYQGQVVQLPLSVGITFTEASADGSCACWCTVLEDDSKVGFLAQAFAS